MSKSLFRGGAFLACAFVVGCGGSGGGGRGSDVGSWINRTAGTAAARLPWIGVASDSTGTQLVAVTAGLEPAGGVWISPDAGATWANVTTGTAASGQSWRSVTSDSTGNHLVAITVFNVIGPPGEDVWTSADAGTTWTKRTTVTSTSTFVVGPTVVSDSGGTHVVIADGDIWTSADSGATWIDQTAGTAAAAQAWVDIAADSTAAHLVAITAYSDIWTSGDGGATWTNRTIGTEASGQDWQGVASDSTGTNLVAVCKRFGSAGGVPRGGDIWTSADAGVTWTNRTAGTAASGKDWIAVASDSGGGRLVAASAHGLANDVWTSADAGATWRNETTGTPASGQQWLAVASDTTGTHLVALSSDPPGGGPCCRGDIWTN